MSGGSSPLLERHCVHLSRPVPAARHNICSSRACLNASAPDRLFLRQFGLTIMRCLVVADLHYSLPQFDWLLAAAPEFDLVIFAGDALDIGSLVDFRAQILVVKKYLSLLSARTRVILCSGNHDLDERSAEGEKISRWIGEVRELGIACDGDSLAIDDTLFTVCPWWDGPLVKQRIEDQLRDAAAKRLPRWVWVHHAPPANSPTSWGGK